jgi:hypothetical protein
LDRIIIYSFQISVLLIFVFSDGIVPLPKFENSTTILTATRIGTEEDNYI